MKLVQQYYTEPKYINITGKGYKPTSMMYNPQTVKNTEFDLTITESSSTPAYRMVMNEFLLQLFQMGQLTLTEILENGSFPFADKLLQSIKDREEKAAQQGMGNGGADESGMIPQDISQAVKAGTNPLVQQMISKQQNMAS
jgi:hypothetical protein